MSDPIPFTPKAKPTNASEPERCPSPVVNLWVHRQELAREAEDNRVLWRCHCDSLLFLYYAVEGLVCAQCGKQSTRHPK